MRLFRTLALLPFALLLHSGLLVGQERQHGAGSAANGSVAPRGPLRVAARPASLTEHRGPLPIRAPAPVGAERNPRAGHRHRGLRFTLIGGALGGVVGAIWIGEAASKGTSEATLSKGGARAVGAVVGVVGGGIAGALIHLMTRPAD